TSNKALIENLKGEIDDFKNINKSLESSNKFFKEANNKLSETNNLLYADYKKSEAELARRNSTECLNEEMVANLRYFNSLESEVDSIKSQLESQKTQFLNEIDRLSREYYYADHMNAILGVYTKLDEVTNLQCDYLKLLEKCEGLETELSKSKMMSKSFESVQKHAINLELELQQCKEKIKNDMLFKVNKTTDFCNEREQYFEIQDLKSQLQDKGIVISELKKLIEKLKGKSVDTKFKKSSVLDNRMLLNVRGDRVMHNNSQGKKQAVEDHRRSVKLSKNKTSVTACNDSLNAKTLNVKSVSAMCDKCVLIDTHAMKLYEHVSKTCRWWYPKFTPSGYKWKPKSGKENVNLNLVEIVLFIIDSGCSKHMTGNLKLLINFMEQFLGTVKFGNDQIAPILGYGDLVQGAVTIKRVYYVEGINHNLFLVGSRGTDLYLITLQDTNSPNPICLMAKATSSQAWLWHRRLSHLNFNTINLLSKNDIVVGLPKLKFMKDHLCSSCELGKAKSKDETPEILIDFLRLVQKGQVRVVQTDKGMEFLNQTLHAYFAAEGILHQTDGENLDKMKEKGNDCIFVGYSTQSRAYRVFNKRTRVIMESIHVNFDELPQMESDQINRTVTMSNELDLLFSLMFDELLNGSSKVVSKSSDVSAADAPNQRQHHTTPLNNHTTPSPTCQVPTLAPTVISSENINQAETYAENDQVADDEFINIFSTPVQDQGETSSHHVDSSNMHTFYQRYPSEHHWTKDHPLEQVIGNPSQSVRTRRQLESNAEMCMFALTEELHQFDRLDMDVKNAFLYGPLKEEVKFEMSMMGELKFFLGIQIHQSPRGIFINQAKYAQEILKKHGMTSCDSIGTLMATKHLDADLSGTPVDQTKYRTKVGALMYLTASRPDIMHAIYYCARYQAQPTKKHLTAVKRIFQYHKDIIHMGLWYPKDTGFELTAFSDSDHAGCLD
nr:integrase, catalytic region, zinc finger, CCHC-type, peptidase aspartic, catalytic [Tanacetum cinerariifolium]